MSAFRRKLARMIESNSVKIHPGLTVGQFVADLGCTLEQFLHVIGTEYGSKVDDAVGRPKAMQDSDLLHELLPRKLLNK